MSKDITPATTTPDTGTPDTGTPDTAKPFVRVFREADTGNVILALDAEAMAGLLTVLDAADLKEMADNPGYVGLDDDEAHLASAVGYDILGQLRGLAPYSY